MNELRMDNVIYILNRSTILTDADIEAVIPALQQNVDDFEAAWKLGATKIGFAGLHVNPPSGAWQLEILDHTDTPGAGGYHQDENGRVSGKAFAADAIEYGDPWTVDVSHEMLEMIADPFTDAIVPVPGMALEWFQEVCDPVEANQFGYMIGNVLVSDFVLPAYKQGGAGPYDFKNYLPAGCPTMVAGGYITLYDPITQEYHQKFAPQADSRLSRRALNSRRSLPR